LTAAAAAPLSDNQLLLLARLAQCAPLRYTPAGLAVQDMLLEHASQQFEAGHLRHVTLTLKAVAFGEQAQQLSRLALGTRLRCAGFLAAAYRGKGVVFHLQHFEPIDH